MNPFWPFLPMTAPLPATDTRGVRLRDLDARMSSFLAQKEHQSATCTDVVDNVKGRRSRLRGELLERSSTL